MRDMSKPATREVYPRAFWAILLVVVAAIIAVSILFSFGIHVGKQSYGTALGIPILTI